MRPRLRLRLALLLAGLLLAVSSGSATTVVPPEFPEMVAGSDYVVRAKVKQLATETREHQGRPIIFTRVALDVTEIMAGHPPPELVLTVLGGRTDEGELRVEGVPAFRVGDEDILFVKDNGKNFYPLYAVMHGRYPVKRDKSTGREYVTRANGVPLADVAEVALPLSEGNAAALQRKLRAPAQALSVTEFASAIRQTRAARNSGGRENAK